MTFDEWWKQYLKAGGSNHFNIMADEESARAAWIAATKTEREACARACLDMQLGWCSDDHLACASAIRERPGLNEQS